MVLIYLQVPVQYNRLFRLLDVQPFGTPGHHLERLSKLGVDVTYREGSLLALTETLNRGLPAITLVRTGFLPYWSYSTNHAVVVIGHDGSSLFVNDPAFSSSPIQIDIESFELAWMAFDYRYGILALDPASHE